jgi:hypothetical protein
MSVQKMASPSNASIWGRLCFPGAAATAMAMMLASNFVSPLYGESEFAGLIRTKKPDRGSYQAPPSTQCRRMTELIPR